MQIIEWPQFLENDFIPAGKTSAITVGVFDGVHRGHRLLIEEVVSRKDAVPVIITFRQNDHKKVSSRGNAGAILTFRQKAAIYESLGAALAVVIDFTESFKRMSGKDFTRLLQERGKMSFMAVGSNFRCGYQLDADAMMIREWNARRGIATCVAPPLAENGEPISSSLIRAAVARGNLAAAASMLGRPFTVDLLGASVSFGNRAGVSSAAYDIAGRGGLLPPPGKYPVFLLGKNNDKKTEARVDIHVADGAIIIAKDFAALSPEYVEF